jgi:hypothetical protein
LPYPPGDAGVGRANDGGGADGTGAGQGDSSALESADVGSSSGADVCAAADAGHRGPDTCGSCTADGVSQTLIDDMSGNGTQIQFASAACGDPGTWFNYADPAANVTPPSGAFVFSSLPAPLPIDAGSSPNAACMRGVTGPANYSTVGMGFDFGMLHGTKSPMFVDARARTGIQFWVWGAEDAGVQTVGFSVGDAFGAACFGVCDPTSLGGPTVCGGGNSTPVRVRPGWQLIQVAFADLSPNPYYGGANEICRDSSNLINVTVQIVGGSMPFDFCIQAISFY